MAAAFLENLCFPDVEGGHFMTIAVQALNECTKQVKVAFSLFCVI